MPTHATIIAVIACLLSSLPVHAQTMPPPEAEATVPHYYTITLQGLNKVTGHISQLEAPVGTVMHFGTLEIVARRCWKSAPEERPENAALLEILELKPAEAPSRIFLGWMFSSSPGLSGLEHAVYDVTVLACEAHSEFEAIEKPVKTEKKK